MRGITRAAAYLPAGIIDGHRAAGPDEDGFTLAATALERLLDPSGRTPPIRHLWLAGDLPPTADADLARFLGATPPTERFGVGEAGTRAALHAASNGDAGEAADLVVLADLTSDRSGAHRAARRTHADAGVALWIGETARSNPWATTGGPFDDSGWATAPLFRSFSTREADATTDRVGDWDAIPGRDRWAGAAAKPRSSVPVDGPVSQGAYVPRARYLENLPSRWRFTAEKCGACAALTFPARGRCRQCGARGGLETVGLPRDGGLVVSTTTIGAGGQPAEFDQQVGSTGPYDVVLVELAPGVRGTLQVTDAAPREVAIGSRVGTRLRRLYPMEGEWRYGRKAAPLE